ncbi:MAG TPA: 16S rRNA (cytidine(1402)-2'-O)-methyltransferase [Woeseiaceae bacterium]
MNSGTLFIIATPIGNLGDLSPRARQLLTEVDLVAAEDTRHTGRLLSHFGIKTPLLALHDHNERDAVDGLIAKLQDNLSVALVSDAGTPLISDPGFRLVHAAHGHRIRVSPVPGPSAAVAALSAAGLPSDRYCFEGFLPAKRKARRDRLEELRTESRSMVFYAAVHRIREVLEELAASFGNERQAFIGRELTKMHEQCVAAALGELLVQVDGGVIPAKGEFVIVTGGTKDAPVAASAMLAEQLLRELMAVLPAKQAVAIVSRVCGLNRNAVYRDMLALTGQTGTGEAS